MENLIHTLLLEKSVISHLQIDQVGVMQVVKSIEQFLEDEYLNFTQIKKF
jgi:hypothetical protein